MTSLKGKSILIIDDDIDLCKSLKYGLIVEGATVDVATDGRSGIQKFEKSNPDLVLLDIRMPEVDGWETAKYLRMISHTPIIMLTSLKEDHEMIKGLNLGADDYVTKPFNPNVLLARIDSVLRRHGHGRSGNVSEEMTALPPDRYEDDYLMIDLKQRVVQIEGTDVKLSTTEFDILAYLYRNANSCVTYQTLLEQVWGKGFKKESDYARVYISFLRRKIEADPRNPRYLINEYRRGYRFRTFDPITTLDHDNHGEIS